MSGRDVSPGTRDADRRLDRSAELDALMRAVDNRFNVLLTSHGQSERASVLRAVRERLTQRAERINAVFSIDAAGIPGGAELATLVARSLTMASERAPLGGPDDEPPRDRQGDPLTMLAQAVAVHRSRTGGWVVVLINDVLGAAGHMLFGSARDQVWEMGAVWIVTADVRQRGTLLLPPADQFYAKTIEL